MFDNPVFNHPALWAMAVTFAIAVVTAEISVMALG